MPTYDFESGTIDAVFRNGSDNPWVIDSADPYAGTYCVKSGNGGVNNSSSYLTAIIDVTTAGTMSCRWGVESEVGYDKCAIIIDGVIQTGFSADAATLSYGLFTSAPLPIGPHIIQFVYTKDLGAHTGKDAMYLDDIVLPAHTDFAGTIEDFSGGIPSPGWTNGTNPWTSFTTPYSIFGSSCLRSDDTLADNQASDISYTVDCDAGDMFFAYRVSSEYLYDTLKFYVDGVLKLTVSGSWPSQDSAIGFIFHRETVASGSRTFKWEYSKDTGGDIEEDNGYLDALYVPASSGAITSEITSGAFTLAGSTVGSLHDRVSDISTDVFNLTGSSVDSLLTRKSQIDPGSYVLTGSATGSFGHFRSQIDPGLFVLSGSAIDTLYDHLSQLSSGAFTLAGSNLATVYNHFAGVESAAFTLAGSTVDTIYGALTPTVEIEPGSFVLTGQSVSTLHDHLLAAESGAFALLGQNIDTNYVTLSTAEIETGAFTLTGPAVGTLRDSLSRLDHGAFTLSGANIDTTLLLVSSLDPALFVLTGSAVTGRNNRVSALSIGAFTITGSNIDTAAVPLSDSILDIQLVHVDAAFNFIHDVGNKVRLSRATAPITLERVAND